MKRMLALLVTLSLLGSSVFAGPATTAGMKIRQSIAAGDVGGFRNAVNTHSKYLGPHSLGVLFTGALKKQALTAEAVDLLENKGFLPKTDLTASFVADFKPKAPPKSADQTAAEAIIVKLADAAKGFNFGGVASELGNLKGNAWTEADRKAALKAALEDPSVKLEDIAADVITKQNLELAIGVIDALEWSGIDTVTFVGHVVTKAELEYRGKFDASVATSVNDTAIIKTATLTNFTAKAGGVDVTRLTAMEAHTGLYAFATPPTDEDLARAIIVKLADAAKGFNFGNVASELGNLKGNAWTEADRKAALKAALEDPSVKLEDIAADVITKQNLELAIGVIDALEWSGIDTVTFVGHVVTKAEAEYTPKFDPGVATSVDDTAIIKTATLTNFTAKAGGVDVTRLTAMGAHTGAYAFTTPKSAEETARDTLLADLETELSGEDYAAAAGYFATLKAGTGMPADEAANKAALKATKLPGTLDAITSRVTGASKDHIKLAVLYANMVEWTAAFSLNDMLTNLLDALKLPTHYAKWKAADAADKTALVILVNPSVPSTAGTGLLEADKMFLEKDFEALSNDVGFVAPKDLTDIFRVWKGYTDKSVFLGIFSKKSDENGSIRYSLVNKVPGTEQLVLAYFLLILSGADDFKGIIDGDAGFDATGRELLISVFKSSSQQNDPDLGFLEDFAEIYKGSDLEGIFKNVLEESSTTVGSMRNSLKVALDNVKGAKYFDLFNVYFDICDVSNVDFGNTGSGILKAYVDALLDKTSRKDQIKKASKMGYKKFIDALENKGFKKDKPPLADIGAGDLSRLGRSIDDDPVAFHDRGWASKLYDSIFGSKPEKVALGKRTGSNSGQAPLKWYQRLFGIRSRAVALNR